MKLISNLQNMLLIAVVASLTVFAQESGENELSYIDRLEKMAKKIEKKTQEYQKLENSNPSHFNLKTASYIKAVRKMFQEENPKDDEKREIFATCSLMVEASISQLQMLKKEAEKMDLQKDIISYQEKLSNVHDSILNIERSKASELKSKLDEEQRKAEKLRREAQKRFNELQSSLINVKKDARGTIISMSDILFDIDKATLKQKLKTNLAKIAGILTVFKNSNIIVEGHTDNQGSEDYNQRLSEKRAENVLNFLVDQGVAAERLSSVGYGFSRPIADNSTSEGRQKNRRVDLVIQEKKLTPPTDSKDW